MNFSNQSINSINWWDDLNINRDWRELNKQLDWIWYLHCYAFASLYFAISSITLVSVLRLRTSFATNPHFYFLNLFLLILGLTRALHLYLDPYGSKNLLPILLSKIIWDIGFPCVCSALALLQLGFIHQLNEIKFNSSLISSESCVFIAITMHFCLIIISDLLLVLQNSLKLIYISVNIIFSIWIVFICLVFLIKSIQLLQTFANLKSSGSFRVTTAGSGGGGVGTDYTNKSPNVSHSKKYRLDIQMKSLVANNKYDPRLVPPPTNKLANDGSVVIDENRPRIKITDENELTVSYASDNTPSQCFPSESGHSSTSGSLKRNESNSIYRQSPKFNNKRHTNKNKTNSNNNNNKYNGNKIVRKNSNHSSIGRLESPLKNIAEINDLRDDFDDKKSVTNQQQIEIYSSQCQSQQQQQPKQQPSNRDVFENLVKRIIHLMAYGLIITVLQCVGTIGANGIFKDESQEIILWFSYQTLYRVVELLLVFTTVSITSKSFHNYIYEFRPNFKQRSLRKQ